MLENIRQKKLFFAWYFPILRRYFLDYHITKMFILKALLSKSGPQILICRPRVSFVPVAKRMAQKTLKCGKSKSQGLKWQQCPQNYYFCLISYDYTNVGHYAICNREKMKTLQCLHCNVFMFLAIRKWRHCNALQGKNMINVLMAGWKLYFIPLDL